MIDQDGKGHGEDEGERGDAHRPGKGGVAGPEGHRRALGALFFVLAIVFLGIAVEAGAAARDTPGLVVVATAAAAIALWLGSLAYRSWRQR
ncbi:MAG: hypothetical protein M3R70_04770 [Actinomycetota bacterium]|nr:hypothetical protein [Actinomycetota bacterium]